MEKVPPRKVEISKRNETTFTLSFAGSVNIAIKLMRLPRPSLAPGAKEKGVGINRSTTEITTACAANIVIKFKVLRLEFIIDF
ncbi:hypothetical protein SUT503_04550 [Streptococcus parasuis]|nr:hypothetical protein SUT286_04590 [Streptococcus parasuis]BCP63397.1 hypothetical protein SUT503_04550 [Streptococcus parasuis]